MSKILILFHQNIIDPKNIYGLSGFYESFAKELAKYSNEVKCLNIAFLKDYPESEITELNREEKEKFLTTLKNFNPEIIFSFNNQITKEIINVTNCPIFIVESDGIDYFPNKHFIKQYLDRYYMVSFSAGFEEDKYYSIGFKKEKICYLHLATSINSENLEKKANISFIGTKFPSISKELFSKIKNNKDIYQDLLSFYKEPYKNGECFFEKYTKEFNAKIIDLYPLQDYRVYVLQSVWDLGVDIYGVFWDNLPAELFPLVLSFNKEPRYSLKHNQDIYNSSRINISISHPQCKGYSFPWRIYDIMASNGLLISSYSELLKNYTKDFVDIPMYKSPYEARELCQYALKNPSYCQEIIEKSNLFIEKHGRWKENFKILQDKFKINLLNETNLSKEYEILKVKNISSSSQKSISNFKYRLQALFYSVCLVVAQIPFIDKFFKSNIREKIIYRINRCLQRGYYD